MSQKRGAPFDIDNIFNIPAIDGGEFVSRVSLNFQSIDGGSIAVPPIRYIDGGSLPPAGTASYDPQKDYGPESPNLLEQDDG
jgi:hypothetical protein